MKTGNVKQVTAFEKLLGICNDLGARYNPSKESIKPTAMNSLFEQAQQTQEAVNVARAAHILAVNARKESFAGIPKLAARIVRAVKASDDGTPENVNDAKLIKRKLLPKTVKRKPVQTGQPNGSDAIPQEVRSSSRLDYDGKADTFANLIQFVQGLPSYNPNEPDLTVDGLKATLQDLKTRSSNVIKAQNTFSKARIARNKVLYGKGGIYETGTTTKDYIRSVFGAATDPVKQLGQIQFYNFNS